MEIRQMKDEYYPGMMMMHNTLQEFYWNLIIKTIDDYQYGVFIYYGMEDENVEYKMIPYDSIFHETETLLIS